MLYLTLSDGTKVSHSVATGLTIRMDGGQTIEISAGKRNCVVLQVPAVENDTAPARLCIHPGASNVIAVEIINDAGDH